MTPTPAPTPKGKPGRKPAQKDTHPRKAYIKRGTVPLLPPPAPSPPTIPPPAALSLLAAWKAARLVEDQVAADRALERLQALATRKESVS